MTPPARLSLAGPSLPVLIVAASIDPLSLTAYLPALPGIARDLGVDYAAVQVSVPLYLVAVAVLQLVIGPASDRFGRRPLMIACMGLLLLGSVLAAFAESVGALLAARTLQAFSVGGVVLSRAIVRDSVAAEGAASRLAYVVMGMSGMTLVAPILGGTLSDHFGWRAIFLMMAAFAAAGLVIVVAALPETNRARSASLAAQLRGWRELVVTPRFWGYAATSSFITGGFFAFLGGGPYVSTQILGLSASEYGVWFGLLGIGYMCGNFVTGRFATRLGLHRIMLGGAILSAAGVALSGLIFALGVVHPASLFVPLAIALAGMGSSNPNAVAAMVSIRPDLAGSASGLGGTMQMGLGACLSLLVGALLSPTAGPWPVIGVMLATALIATGICVAMTRGTRRGGFGA